MLRGLKSCRRLYSRAIGREGGRRGGLDLFPPRELGRARSELRSAIRIIRSPHSGHETTIVFGERSAIRSREDVTAEFRLAHSGTTRRIAREEEHRTTTSARRRLPPLSEHVSRRRRKRERGFRPPPLQKSRPHDVKSAAS